MRNHFEGGTHHHYYSLSQQELDLESRVVITFRGYPKLKQYIDERAKREGVSASRVIETALIKFFKSEKAMREFQSRMDEIVAENFL